MKGNLLIERLDKLGYGLIYPAFFGNMIYDLILAKRTWSGGDLVGIDYWSCCIVVLYFMVDYIHLNVDLEKIVQKRKTLKYIACDIGTSIAFFAAFVFIKEGCYQRAIFAIAIIPVLMFIYNYRNQSSRTLYTWFSLANFFYLIALFVFVKDWKDNPIFILIPLIVDFVIYTFYVFCYYPKAPKLEDIKFMRNLKNRY